MGFAACLRDCNSSIFPRLPSGERPPGTVQRPCRENPGCIRCLTGTDTHLFSTQHRARGLSNVLDAVDKLDIWHRAFVPQPENWHCAAWAVYLALHVPA